MLKNKYKFLLGRHDIVKPGREKLSKYFYFDQLTKNSQFLRQGPLGDTDTMALQQQPVVHHHLGVAVVQAVESVANLQLANVHPSEVPRVPMTMVLVGSTSLSARTLIRAVPSISISHSDFLLNSPALIFSEICSSSSCPARSSHGLIRVGSKSGIS